MELLAIIMAAGYKAINVADVARQVRPTLSCFFCQEPWRSESISAESGSQSLTVQLGDTSRTIVNQMAPSRKGGTA